MLKNAQANGHSSKVRGWLVVDGIQHELAQVGPDFCILREPRALSKSQAELIVEVDGDQRMTIIQIAESQSHQKRIVFVQVKNEAAFS